MRLPLSSTSQALHHDGVKVVAAFRRFAEMAAPRFCRQQSDSGLAQHGAQQYRLTKRQS
jgi:hypothetical protein